MVFQAPCGIDKHADEVFHLLQAHGIETKRSFARDIRDGVAVAELESVALGADWIGSIRLMKTIKAEIIRSKYPRAERSPGYRWLSLFVIIPCGLLRQS